jgi:hypothetical protein
LDLLMIGRPFDATDPRGKVYSVPGMAEVPVENDKPVESAMAMRIDYSQSISQVYQYLVKFMINRDNNLDVLSIISTHRDANSLDLPTWTPDWRVPTHPFHWTATWSTLPTKWEQQASPKQSHKTKPISVSLRLADSTYVRCKNWSA